MQVPAPAGLHPIGEGHPWLPASPAALQQEVAAFGSGKVKAGCLPCCYAE